MVDIVLGTFLLGITVVCPVSFVEICLLKRICVPGVTLGRVGLIWFNKKVCEEPIK